MNRPKMRKPTTVTSAMIAITVGALLLASCAGDDGDDTTADDGSDFPDQDITLVVGRSAGGGHDEYARAIAPLLEEELGTTVVVENVEGAGGRVAAEQMLDAGPDGYTLHLMEPNGLAAFQAIGEAGYELTNYTTLGIVNARPSTFAVATDSPIQSWEDLVAAGNDAELRFATSGLTSPNFSNGAIAATDVGIQFTPVPHEGSAEAITSVIRGDTDFTVFSGDSIAEHVETGDLRALVQFGMEPLDTLADTPTADAVGLDQFHGVLTTNLILVAPPELPEDIRTALTEAIDTVLNSEELATWADEGGRIIEPGTPEETDELINQALETYGQWGELLTEYLGS